MKRLIITGLLVFLLVLVATFPARVAYRWLAPAELQLSGIEGSLWSGRAAQAMAAGAYFTDISWRLIPQSLLSGELAYAATARPASGSLAADVSIGATGELIIENLVGTLPLDLAHPAFQANGIGGDLDLQFTQLTLIDSVPVAAEGVLTVSNLFVRDLSAAVIGDIEAEFRTMDGRMTATVSDLSGVIEVSGDFVVEASRSYRLTGLVRARPDAPPSIEQQLQFLGSPDNAGMRPFRFEGSL
jgi:general secretion pathway protein N